MADMVLSFLLEWKQQGEKAIQASIKGLQTSAKDMQNSLAVKVKDLGFDDLGTAIGKIPLGLAAVGAAAGAVATVGKFAIDAAMNVKDLAIEFDILSQKSGASVEFLSGFRAAANDAEISSEQFNTAIVKFSDNLFTLKGAGANVEAELFALADTFATMADGPEKTALAIDRFGKAGAAMIPILNQGSEGLKSLMQNMADAGRVIDSETVAAANRLDDAMDKLDGSIQGITLTLGTELIPALTDVINGANSLYSAMTLLPRALNESSSEAGITAQTLSRLTEVQRDLMNMLVALNPALGLVVKNMGGIPTAANAAGKATIDASGKVIISGQNALTGAALWALAVQKIFTAGASIATMDLSGVAARYKKNTDAMAENTRSMANRQIYLSGIATTSQIANQNRLASEYGRTNDVIEQSFKKSFGGGGGGGAAGAVKELSDEMKVLEDRTNSLKGSLSASTEEMDQGEQLQTAFAIATGELTLEQFEQQQAMKGLLEALKNQKITQEQALTTVLAMREGLATSSDAFGVAGESGNKYKGELDAVTGVVDTAKKNVNDMGTAIKNLPADTKVDVTATVLGKKAVDDLKSVVDSFHDKTVSVTVVTKYVDEGNGTSDVPERASGGPAKGWTLVGEEGPELVYFGDKAHVFSNSQSKRMAGQSGGAMGGNTYVTNRVTVNTPINISEQNPKRIAKTLANSQRSAASAARLRAAAGFG